ncbi:hypothetical protein HanOQP8_Chr11g0423031 [Helianthus annuus]|nr:hypothetical protein HanOQP8_Chr11g0423031 [Helianthus annuus]
MTLTQALQNTPHQNSPLICLPLADPKTLQPSTKGPVHPCQKCNPLGISNNTQTFVSNALGDHSNLALEQEESHFHFVNSITHYSIILPILHHLILFSTPTLVFSKPKVIHHISSR